MVPSPALDSFASEAESHVRLTSAVPRYSVEYALIREQALELDFACDSTSNDLDDCRERASTIESRHGSDNVVVVVWERSAERDVLVG